MIATPSPAVSPSLAGPTAAAAPRLLEQVRAAAQSRRYSAHTEEAFAGWIRRFVVFHDKRHPDQLGEPEVTRFLSHLAVEDHVSPATQSQARAALVFLYRYAAKAQPALRQHLDMVRRQHDWDLPQERGRVPLPSALARKDPNADREWGWQWVFPAPLKTGLAPIRTIGACPVFSPHRQAGQNS